MKISNRNTIKNQLHKILLLFCGLFLFTSIFLGDSSFSSGRYEIENYSIITNQKKTDNSFFQNWTLSLPYNVLSILNSESEEESEPTYESKIESDFQIIISFFNHNILKSSFANFYLSFQKRVTIPFFLLHHSWKIPSI